MATKIQGMKSERRDDNKKNEEESQKIKKKRKMTVNDIYPKQSKTVILSEEKKPHLSDAVFGGNCEISYEQLYEFLRYAALGKEDNAAQSSWCRIHHRRHLSGVAVVVLHEVSQLHFYLYYLQFKFLRKIFRHHFSLPPVSGDFMERLCGSGVKANHQISRQELEKDPIICKYGKERRGISAYILTPEEMYHHNYPIEGREDCSHFVYTHCIGSGTDSSPLFGLDCEMCLTDKGSELTRIAVVDASGQCVLDELVKPKLPIINYLTSYSGITKKLLHPVVTTLSDIQNRLKNLLPANAVLVGHSLNFDLWALEMVHQNVIDTSLLFARNGGRRFKLKFLAKAVLGKEIQCIDGAGHDPTEDARCALELAQYFIKQGPRKVAEMNLEAQLLEIRKVEEEQSCVLPKQKNGLQKWVRKPTQSLLDILQSVGQKTLLLGRWNGTASHNCQNQTGPQNKQILQRALEEVPKSSFSVIQFALDSRHVTSVLSAKMKTKLTDLLTIYAGPFRKDICLKSLKKVFKKYGHIQSIKTVPETCKQHICIHYEVLEAAQLAVESLDGAEVEGLPMKSIGIGRMMKESVCQRFGVRQQQLSAVNSSIKCELGKNETPDSTQAEPTVTVCAYPQQVQRPITETTLECEMLVKKLEKDADNQGVIYLAGLRKTQREANLQQELSYLKGLTSVFLPRDPTTGKSRNYCFLKFQTPEHAADALATIEEATIQGSNLHCRWALTPPHLHQWASHTIQNGGKLAATSLCHELGLQEKQPPFVLEQDVQKQMKMLDRSIKKLYQRLPEHTLCVVLLLGINRLWLETDEEKCPCSRCLPEHLSVLGRLYGRRLYEAECQEEELAEPVLSSNGFASPFLGNIGLPKRIL